ncbi:hypothetical protein ALI144C_06765 [Actinosynnema sp. ALI-1.44]|nr:hypothetical protein ALI144C_06765 [Actinosynnema sp. ALI-1.44]
MAAVLGIAFALAFVALGVLVGNRVPAVDRWIVDEVEIPAGSSVQQLSFVVSTVGVLAGFAVLVVVAVRAWWRQPRRGGDLMWCAALLLMCAAVAALQFVFRRPGPPGQPIGFSYPSGHAAVAGAMAVTAVVVAAVFVRTWLRTILVVQCTAVLLTMVSRVALAEHYLSDVVGSVLGVCAIGLLGSAAVERWWARTATS